MGSGQGTRIEIDGDPSGFVQAMAQSKTAMSEFVALVQQSSVTLDLLFTKMADRSGQVFDKMTEGITKQGSVVSYSQPKVNVSSSPTKDTISTSQTMSQGYHDDEGNYKEKPLGTTRYSYNPQAEAARLKKQEISAAQTALSQDAWAQRQAAEENRVRMMSAGRSGNDLSAAGYPTMDDGFLQSRTNPSSMDNLTQAVDQEVLKRQEALALINQQQVALAGVELKQLSVNQALAAEVVKRQDRAGVESGREGVTGGIADENIRARAFPTSLESLQNNVNQGVEQEALKRQEAIGLLEREQVELAKVEAREISINQVLEREIALRQQAANAAKSSRNRKKQRGARPDFR